MNTTMNVSRGSDHGTGYVSMIKIDGMPILPPIMTESRRAEMRRYRELAIRVETNQQFNKRDRRIQFLQNQKEQEQMNKEKDQTDSVMNSTMTVKEDNSINSNKKTDFEEPIIDKEDENDTKAPKKIIQVTVEQEEEDQNSNGNSSDTNSSESEDFNIDIASPLSPNNNSIETTEIPITITTTIEINEEKGTDSNYKLPIIDNVELKTTTANNNTTPTTTTNTTQLFNKKCIPENEQQQQKQQGQPEDEAMLNDSRRILVEDDNKSESMSLVSLDQEEEAQRREMEKGTNEDDYEEKADNNNGIDENNSDNSNSSSIDNFLPASGRSSTETFIIERHNTTSDSDNNNEFYTPRKYFFSPLPGESGETSIVMFKDNYNNNDDDEDDDNDDDSNSVSTSTNTQSTQYPENNNETITITNVKNTKIMKVHHPRPSVYNCKRYFDSPTSTPPSSAKSYDTEKSSTNINNNNNNNSNNNNNTNDNTLKYDSSFTSSSSPSLHSPYSSNNSKNVTITINSHTTPPPPPSSNYDVQHEKENIMINPPTLRTPTKRNSSSPASSSSTASNNYYYTSPKNISSPQLPRPSTFPSKRYFASPVSSRNSQSEATFQDSSNTTYTPPPLSSPKSTSTIIATNLSAANSIARSGYKLSPALRSMDFDPIYRGGASKRELKIPPQALDPAMKPKFDRVSAAVKGYLVRRLLRTEKIQMIIQTIRDTVELVLKLHEEVPQLRVRNGTGIKPEDAELCRRLFQQLTGACTSFHDIFFKLTTVQRMAIIANDREKLKAKELKTYMSRSRSGDSALGAKSKRSGNLSGRKISNATVKCLERRLTIHN